MQALRRLAMFAAVLVGAGGTAQADIIKIQSVQSCNVIGLDSSPATAVGGVHCAAGNDPFSLQGILDGTIALYVGNSQTPSWNVINDTGAPLTNLTLFYSGALASNANIDMQISGTTIFHACKETTSANVSYSDANCGTGDIAPSPVGLPLKMEWSGGTGVGVNGTFNIGTASFAHAGYDHGCISGTSNCQPVTTPEPASGLLLSSALGLAGVCGGAIRPLLRRLA
jgi:hypothetical protein